MTEERDSDLVERVRDAWGRPALSDAERVEFDNQLRSRLRAPRPRRWAWAGGMLAAAATAAVVLVLSVDEGGGEQTDWLDTLVDAEAVALGERTLTETVALYGFDDADDRSVPLFADPAWDPSADTVWESDEALDLGHQYEVLAYWLEDPAAGDTAKTTGVP